MSMHQSDGRFFPRGSMPPLLPTAIASKHRARPRRLAAVFFSSCPLICTSYEHTDDLYASGHDTSSQASDQPQAVVRSAVRMKAVDYQHKQIHEGTPGEAVPPSIVFMLSLR